MSRVTMVNHLVIKPGKIDEFIAEQRKFAESLPPCGLIGGRMYRSVDGRSVTLMSVFQSKAAQEEVFQRADLKENIRKLASFVESSNPIVHEEAYTYGDFR